MLKPVDVRRTAPRRLRCFVLGLLAAVSAGSSAATVPARAAEIPGSSDKVPPVAYGVRLEQGDDRARLVFALSAPVETMTFVLADPDRAIIDLPKVDFAIEQEGRAAPLRRGAGRSRAAGLVASYRFGRLGTDKSRIVIDLAAPARILRARSEPASTGAGANLVIELDRTDRATFRAAAQDARAAIAGSWSGPSTSADPPPGRPIVVIDPGHGGIDSGAIVNGSVEKDLVLDFARSLVSKLAADAKVAPILTREDDSFVPLTERVRLARESGAGLFVSIHADSLSDATEVAGATVYTVSERASDAAAARLAEKENAADAAAGFDRAERTSEVSGILQDLTRRETRALSQVFARTLVTYWRVAGRLNKNPQRSAGFRVLEAPDVPSVLLELGYLTNMTDDRALTSVEWREKAAARVAEAIADFFTARENAVASTLSAADRPSAAPAGARP